MRDPVGRPGHPVVDARLPALGARVPGRDDADQRPAEKEKTGIFRFAFPTENQWHFCRLIFPVFRVITAEVHFHEMRSLSFVRSQAIIIIVHHLWFFGA